VRGLAGEAGSNGGDRPGGFPKLTPRQAQILDLAAAGLSDKEIARRLGVAHRTVRTHFEKIYSDGGFRNRSQAVAVWSSRPGAGHQRPAAECPYPKPFPPGFSECPAFQATQMVALDISYRPLGSIMTCRHLESRLMPNTDFRWFGACVIGDAEARRRWSDKVGAGRLHEISQLRQEVSMLSGPYVQRLWELKSAQQQNPKLAATIGRQMDAAVDEFMTQMREVLRHRRAVLDQLHLPLEACLRLVRVAIDRFVQQGLAESEWEVPDEVLALFPDDVRSYFRPRQSTTDLRRTSPKRASSGLGPTK
jgi:DNA-binding CsgD family transcriptional regulator